MQKPRYNHARGKDTADLLHPISHLMCDRVVLKLLGNPVELKIIYYMQNVSYVEGKHIPGSQMKRQHLQVHNEFKPSNRAVNSNLYSLRLASKLKSNLLISHQDT